MIVPSQALAAACSLELVDGVRVLRLRAFRTKDVGHMRKGLTEILLPVVRLHGLAVSPLCRVRGDGAVWYSQTVTREPRLRGARRDALPTESHRLLMRLSMLLLVVVLSCGTRAARPQSDPAQIVLETDRFRYMVGTNGRNLSFVDKTTSKDYLKHDPETSVAEIIQKGTRHSTSRIARVGDRLSLAFEHSSVVVILALHTKRTYVVLEVEAIQGGDIDSLKFLDVPLILQASPSEPFGATALSLNLQTRVDQMPVLMTHLQAWCFQRFGLIGAKVAIMGASPNDMVPVLKQVLVAADEMPGSRVAGPWAKEVVSNRSSYIFNFGNLTLGNTDEWIASAERVGATEIDNHGGQGFFRFGDLELDRGKWPDGWETFKLILARLHEHDIKSVLHTYSFLIDKSSKYVTPIPSPYLDSFRTLTLAEAIGPMDDVIEVNESTKAMTTVVGPTVPNSVVLQLDDELVAFSRVSQRSPFVFSGVTRGALGTKAASHARATKARHLKQIFGLFVPDVDTPLFLEIARRHAAVVNIAGFDGIYLDAIDTISILRGVEQSWYWAAKFVFEIQRNLRRPVGMEMSAMWHHWWRYRTRWQAWDAPHRGYKRFIDEHLRGISGGLLLPLQLGWWKFEVFNPPQIETSFTDDVEYLGGKMIGNDAGVALLGPIDDAALDRAPGIRRAVEILRTYEHLRRTSYFTPSIKAKLKEPGSEFHLERVSGSNVRLRPVEYAAHKVTSPENSEWTSVNHFAPQPLKLRIEALMSVAPYDSADSIVVMDSTAVSSSQQRHAKGVTLQVTPTPASKTAGNPGPGSNAASLAVSSVGLARKASWVQLERAFEPPLDLASYKGLGLWIHGDAMGEVLNIRVESPRHVSAGAFADHYVAIDFIGWRYLELVESESFQWSDYVWDDQKTIADVYRGMIDYSKVASVSVWLNNIAEGKPTQCLISPIKALPLVPAVLRNPIVTVGGKTLRFPTEMSAGSYLEYYADGKARLYGPKGELLDELTPNGDVTPQLVSGVNVIRLDSDAQRIAKPRAKVTIIQWGQPL